MNGKDPFASWWKQEGRVPLSVSVSVCIVKEWGSDDWVP